MLYNARYNKSGEIKFMRKTMEKMKEKKGITLIALVVTIAVILFSKSTSP